MAVGLGEVPENTILPRCDVLTKVAALKKVKSGSGKLMFKAEFRVQEDGRGGHKNFPLFEQYVIGSDKDPDGEQQKTWNEAAGARNMKRLMKKLDLDTTKDPDQLVAEAVGREIGLSVIAFTEPAKKKQRIDGVIKEVDNPYAGQERNRINGYWTPGEKEPQIYDDDAEVLEPEAKPVAKAAKAAAIEEEVAAPSKKGNGAAAGANGEAKVETKAADAGTFNCPECGESMPKAQFLSHVNSQHA